MAAGDITTRIDPRGDPALVPIAASFNATAAALEQRVRADARFASDVSHELRSPLTTMLNSLALVQNRRHLLPEEVTEPLDAQPPHPQGVPEDAPFQGGVTDAGPDTLRG